MIHEGAEFQENDLLPDAKEAKLFEAVLLYVLEAGGDGDGWIVVPEDEYHERWLISQKLERFLKPHGFDGEVREDGTAEFGFHQSSICVVKNREALPSWAGDIVVEI